MILKQGMKRILALILSVAVAGAVLVSPLPASAQQGMAEPGTPYGLLTNELEHPLNVEEPTFSWWLEDADVNEVQTAYQLIVRDELTGEVVWDSGKVMSSEQSNVPYGGDALSPAHPYTWTVTTWDSKGNQSPESESVAFATGLTDENWDADWIQKPNLPITVESSGAAARVEGGGLTIYSEGADWADYKLSIEVCAKQGAAGIALRAQDADNAYIWALEPGKGLTKTALVNGEAKNLGTLPLNILEDAYYSVEIVADGDTITTKIDGQLVDTTTDSTFSAGTVGFYEADGQVGAFQKLSVTSLGRIVDSIYVAGASSENAQIVLNDQGYDWGDYILDFDMQINDTSNDATALVLRASSDYKTGYMWQFTRKKAGLARHTRTNGKFNKLDGDGSIPYTFQANTYYHITISLIGNTITTSVNGEVIDTYVDTANVASKGTFGFRNANGEGGTYANLKVTAPDGTPIYTEDFLDLSRFKFLDGSVANTITAKDNTVTYLSPDFSKGFDGWSNSGSMSIADGSNWATGSNSGITLAKTGKDWDNYTLTTRIIAKTGAAGVMFRATDVKSGYMWQIVPGTGLKVHKQVGGKFTALKNPIPCDIKAGQTYRMTIEANGPVIRTYLNGELVDTTEDATYAAGTVGFRQSETGTEVGQFSDLMVTNGSGETIFQDSFTNGLGQWDISTTTAAKGSNLYWYARTEQPLEEGKTPVRALAYMAAAHDYELSVNGTRIGRGQSFDYSSETHYQGWDITQALDGSGTIAVGVLARWYGNGQGRAGGTQGLLGQIVVYYDDGSTQVISTGSDWVAEEAPLSGSTKRNGEGDFVEEYDARKAIADYSAVGLDDSGWMPVHVLGAHPTNPFTNVQPELSHVTEETMSPVSVETLSDGTTLVDFGRVIPARLSVDFKDGVAGRKLTLQTGYELKDNGRINTSNSATQSTKMTFIYTQTEGAQRYDTWDHLAFRYLEIPASAGETFTAQDITATLLYAEVPEGRDSTFTSSNEMLDEVYDLMKISALYSAQNQFVDTPTREKGQFLQDSINIGAVTTTSWYERETSRKAIRQFLDSADRYWNAGGDLGHYNSVYPNGDGKRDIPDFSLNVPIWIWRYYQQTGDREILEYAYPYLQNTADYAYNAIPTEGATAGLVTTLPGGSGDYKNGIVDWPKPGRFDYDMSTAARTTINALSVRVFDTVAQIAEELGKGDSETAVYADRAANLRAAMNEKLITEEGVYCDGLLSDGSQSKHNGQHSTSYALAFDIAPADKVEAMADYVASLGMKQGPMTADILVEALFDAGRADAVLNLMTNTDDLGWAKLIADGNTFTWEQWVHGQSQSHGWGAASAPLILENFLGVKVTAAGAKTVTIDPARDVLDHAAGRVVTERGAVDVSYSGTATDYTLKVTVPVNMQAQVVLPKLEGGQFVDKNGNSGTSSFTEDEQIVTVGSGTREFVFRSYVDANKAILNTVIAYAQEQKDSDEFDNIIAQVQATFTAALDHAVSVADSQFATQEEVDTAWKALMNEIHKLGFVKGDISSLITLVEAAEDIDLSLYVEKGQAEFTAALQAAQAVVADKDNAMEQEIQQATDRLLDAMLELRVKADKSILQALLEDAANVDISLYTAETAADFQAASNAAKDIYDNPDATQAEVNDAAQALQDAISGLKSAGTSAADTAVQGDANATADSGNAKTGETVPMAAAAALLLAGAAAIACKKRSK